MTDSNNDSSDQRPIGQAYDWLDSHGQISYEGLKKMAESGSPEDIERLHQLAGDNGIKYEDIADLMKLAHEISRAMEVGRNTGVE